MLVKGLGMEFADLIGDREEQLMHRDALDAMERLLERLDALAGKRGAASRAGAARRPGKRRRA